METTLKTDNDSDGERWSAVANRDHGADGTFIYGVMTTGIYCRPSCPSRMPNRENVRFYETADEATQDGLRACKRCKPDEESQHDTHKRTVARACRIIEAAESEIRLDDLADMCGLSPYHFHRVFKRVTGMTPKAYSTASKAKRMQEILASSRSVTDAIYDTGFNSNGRFYAQSNKILGMQPNSFRKQGAGSTIRFAVGECLLGSILVAATDIGICAIYLDDDPDALVRRLQDQFPKATLEGGDTEFEQWVAQVVGTVENPAMPLELPVDVQGSVFQKQVWQALCQVPTGQTATYAEIAENIGRPKSVRAVAKAIASNNHAVAIPCHRVIRSDGSLSGYRWGVERKKALLKIESQ